MPGSSPSAQPARRGAQSPRVRAASGDAASTDGGDAADLMAGIGLDLFDWERSVLADWCSRDRADRPSYTTIGLSVARQNGKNAVIESYEVYQLVVCGAHILHTAHRVKTAKKSFQRLVRYFTDRRNRDMCALVENIRYTNGEEAIYLANGGSIEFSARSRAGARGYDDIQIVVFDEAQDLTDDQQSAILYTLAASSTGYRQIVYTGTPPDPGSPGEVFGRVRRAALDGPPSRSVWHEWGVPECPRKGTPFADLVDAVYEANPSMGLTLDLEFTETEFANSDIDGFARERLGWWSEQTDARAIPEADWRRGTIAKEAAPPEGRIAYGVKFSPDGSTVALAAAIRPDDGPVHVECVRVEPTAKGTAWLAEWIADRRSTAACAAVDGLSGAGALAERLAQERPRLPRGYVVRPRSADVATAASMMLEAVTTGGVTHIEQPSLDRSAASAAKRPIGHNGAWGWGGDDPCPLEAATLALWAVKTTRRNPRKGCRLI